jgi:cell division protein FtsW
MNRGDRLLMWLPLALTAIGVVMVYSSSSILGITRYDDANYYLSKQVFRAVLGVIVMVAATRVDLRRLESLAPYLMVGAAVMLAIVVAVGKVSHGAARWLSVGFLTLQPTDLARLAMVVFLAWWLTRRDPAELGFVRGVLPPLGMLGVVAGLILLQPNLSSTALLGVTGLAMLYLAGARIRHLLIPVAAGGAVAALALMTHPYMMGRVKTFVLFLFGGELDGHGSGWQLDQSLIAIGSGGWFGRGIGGGLQKYLFLPEAHTDFIYSIMAEETGFLGSTLLLGLLAALAWRGLRATARAEDRFAYLLAGGLTIQIALYAIANLAVATGLAPTTGLPLPFVSYGGSALLANMAAVGLLYRVSAGNAADEAITRQRWSREVTA